MPASSRKLREVMRIELHPHAKELLTRVTDKIGMTQVAATSRIFEWFVLEAQDAHEIILGLIPKEILPEAAELILKRRTTRKLNQVK